MVDADTEIEKDIGTNYLEVFNHIEYLIIDCMENGSNPNITINHIWSYLCGYKNNYTIRALRESRDIENARELSPYYSGE